MKVLNADLIFELFFTNCMKLDQTSMILNVLLLIVTILVSLIMLATCLKACFKSGLPQLKLL